jgi:hypothetical protein
VINNTLGSVLGAAAYRGVLARTFDQVIAWIVGVMNGGLGVKSN